MAVAGMGRPIQLVQTITIRPVPGKVTRHIETNPLNFWTASIMFISDMHSVGIPHDNGILPYSKQGHTKVL